VRAIALSLTFIIHIGALKNGSRTRTALCRWAMNLKEILKIIFVVVGWVLIAFAVFALINFFSNSRI